jgi:hypothetical protein
MDKLYTKLCEKISEKDDYSSMNQVIWSSVEDLKMKMKPSDKKVKIGLINLPCAGFGDIIVCKTFYDYLKSWYKGIDVTICTSTPDKYSQLKVKGKIVELKYPHSSWQGGECKKIEQLRLKRVNRKIIKFDILIFIPTVNQELDIKKVQKCFPYANEFNTFNVSEYNGDFPPYTFPIGIGKSYWGEVYLGLFLTDNLKIPKQNIMKKPYALAYTAGHDTAANTHTNTCILSFIEMICKKYHKKHTNFQLIIPPWFKDELLGDGFSTGSGLRSRYNKIVKQYYSSSHLVYNDQKMGEKDKLFDKEKDNTLFILRGDILPGPRETFISLMRDSVEDILLTGDQSLTDGLSYCGNNKRIWYQVVPWKQELAYEMGKVIPNKYLDDFRTSCGTIKGIKIPLNNNELIKRYDFRKLGKRRMDSILIQNRLLGDEMIKSLINHYSSSRKKETLLKKFRDEMEMY